MRLGVVCPAVAYHDAIGGSASSYGAGSSASQPAVLKRLVFGVVRAINKAGIYLRNIGIISQTLVFLFFSYFLSLLMIKVTFAGIAGTYVCSEVLFGVIVSLVKRPARLWRMYLDPRAQVKAIFLLLIVSITIIISC